jgi:hypothetical protein
MKSEALFWEKGHYYENRIVENQKEHQKNVNR